MQKNKLKLIPFFVISILCIVASIYVASIHSASQEERNSIKATGQRVSAVAVSRSEIEFISMQGTIRTKPLVSPMQGTLQQQDTYDAVYDRSDPTRVVLLQDDSAYNITIWIVVLKLFGAGIIIFAFGLRKYKKNRLPAQVKQ